MHFKNIISRRIIVRSLILSILLTELIFFFLETEIQYFINNIIRTVSGKAVIASTHYDEDGIPYTIYPDAKKQYNPLFIANEGNAQYRLINEGKDAKTFFHIVRYLEKESILQDDKARIPYHFDFSYRSIPIKAPWFSSLAHGSVMLVFQKAYILSGNMEYQRLAQAYRNGLDQPDIGLTYHQGADKIWFEEYPIKEKPHVLNGMMEILLNLHEHYQLSGDTISYQYFKKGMNALVDDLPLYSNGIFSFYDRRKVPCNRSYHEMHIDQLKQLYEISHEEKLLPFIKQWSVGVYMPTIIQVIVAKSIKRIALYLSFIFALFIISSCSVYLLKKNPKNPDGVTGL